MTLILLLSFTQTRAEDVLSTQNQPIYTQAQLDQMLAPIALYPDALLAQILMASTYPLDVVQAGRWLQNPQNAALQGTQLEAVLGQQTWDPSVKSLVPFPQIIKMMDTNLQWTEKLGDAFLASEPLVMDSVQRLRRQAQASGTLGSTPQQIVSTQGQTIIIQPANPQVVYVPYYDPTVVYGEWLYPAYPPVYFPAPIGFAYGDEFIGFGIGIGIIAPFWGWEEWDWHHHRINIDDSRFRRINNGRAPIASGEWRHDTTHRGGVPYHSAATRGQFQNNAAGANRSYRGYNTETIAPQVYHQQIARPQQAVRQNAVRPNIERSIRPIERPSAPVFESISSGSEARSHAERGAASRSVAAPQNSNRGGGGNENRHR